MGFGRFASTSQFFLYGKKHCTKTGYDARRAALLKAGPDPLESVSLAGKVASRVPPLRHTHSARLRRGSTLVPLSLPF